MPFFGSKFSPKKAPIRKGNNAISTENLDELVLDRRSVKLNLDNNKLVFENGEWYPESGENGLNYKTNQKLRKQMQELSEENNLLRVKYEMILNMLTQTTAESHIQEREIENLKKLVRQE
ncbi:unnamed protein product [Brassicogethes aeneus]|uniref:Chibby n=1 Tax=Brassicogethes aeneus TaxID=1431903 RepID=A0A9P0FQ73_BRAAE|nr:unnamed protein product [Brassicogethes aeneus]